MEHDVINSPSHYCQDGAMECIDENDSHFRKDSNNALLLTECMEVPQESYFQEWRGRYEEIRLVLEKVSRIGEITGGKSMTINEYQTEALRTAAGMNHPNNDEILLNGVMGLAGESGECVDMIKKYRFQGHELDKAHLAKELGDVAWYIAVAAHAIGYDLETVLQMNVDKLRNRYPNGFEAERSLHRQEGDV